MPTTLERVVDSHVHYWDPQQLCYPWLAGEPRLQRPFRPEDLRAAGAVLAGCLVVQADCLDEQAGREVELVTDMARSAPEPALLGVVAQAPLERGAGAAAVVERLAGDPLVVGVRRLLQDEPAGFAGTTEFVTGVGLLAGRGLVFDLCVRQHQLAEVTGLVARLPDVTFVLDHLGKPDLAADSFASWQPLLAALARHANVFCKLSGLTSQGDPGHGTPAGDYLAAALELFGPTRCMYGSDWPVASLTVTYPQWLDVVRRSLAGLGPVDRELVLGGVATGVYGLQPPGAGHPGC